MSRVLVLNAGSSSIKLMLFDEGEEAVIAGGVSEIGGAARLVMGDLARAVVAADHQGALAVLLGALAEAGHGVEGVAAVVHRVVHGGRTLTRCLRVTEAVEAEIAALVPLAPLHNPHALAGMRAVAALAPGVAQYACFDTQFHLTNPEVALRYALPEEEEARGLRRYGFHGLSYASLVARLPGISGAALPERLLALHLGNGASLCAIRGGASVATTMGYSPLSGLTMGTRAGDIDGNAVLRLAEVHGIAGAGEILNKRSGLLALGGQSDMRGLLGEGGDAARFAVAQFRYWVIRHAGSMIAAMGGLDALAFTGGIGERDAGLRAAVIEGLGWLGVELDAGANAAGGLRLHAPGSLVAAWVVPAAEEAWMVREARAAMAL